MNFILALALAIAACTAVAAEQPRVVGLGGQCAGMAVFQEKVVCRAGLSCRLEEHQKYVPDGYCAPEGSLGTNCYNKRGEMVCRRGLTCDHDYGFFHFAACISRQAAVGEKCSPGGWTQCQPGLVCGYADRDYTCQPKPADAPADDGQP